MVGFLSRGAYVFQEKFIFQYFGPMAAPPTPGACPPGCRKAVPALPCATGGCSLLPLFPCADQLDLQLKRHAELLLYGFARQLDQRAVVRCRALARVDDEIGVHG